MIKTQNGCNAQSETKCNAEKCGNSDCPLIKVQLGQITAQNAISELLNAFRN